MGAVSPLFNSCLFLKAGHEFLKPTIWVSPSRVVALGGSVTIRCEGLYSDMEFFLRKAGQPNPQRQTVPDGTVAEFPIANVSWEDGGSYTCDYRSITDQSRWSYLSDPVEIIVGGEGGARLSAPAPSPTPSQTHRGSLHNGTLRARLCHDPWAQQRGRPAGERGQSHWGVPQPWGRSSHWRFGTEEGGIPVPGGAAEQGTFPRGILPISGDAQRARGPGAA
uniref:Ig-like domain-containing protein n=1 Tax=Chrysemys picta bellii TaxID=8478 RepID=A0A8C3HBT2_CHRPI